MKRKEYPSPDKIDQSNKSVDKVNQSNHSVNHIINPPAKMSRMEIELKKSDKYDRQLRLWGEKGQFELENAHVCLLNASATGTEILKCLVLPGIGKFTIIDESLTKPEDLGTNFFLNEEALGQSKAQCAYELLQELNEDTTGHFYQEKPVELLEKDPQLFKSFSVVIASRLSEHDLLKFDQFLWHHNIPLIVCDTFGFLGYLRIVVKEHPVIEAHPDNALDDLRLDEPFDELKSYMENIDLSKMDKLEHSHTPYLVLLYKFLQKWQAQTGLNWPSNYKEKCQIKELIKENILKDENGVNIIEENFEEALQNVNNAFVKSKISSDIEKILTDALSVNLRNENQNSQFWILVRALREFVSQHHKLPLRGTLPDMFSDSQRYIELQTIYKRKADQDIEMVFTYAQEALNDLQLPSSFITKDQVKLFCKNASFLKLLRGKSVHDEYKDGSLKESLSNLEESDYAIYLTYRVVSRAFSENDIDKNLLLKIAAEVHEEIGLEKELPTNYVEEIFRVGFSEFHSLAAIMGGIAAQEVIKLITKQFIPVDNVFIYNSISNTTSSLKV